MQISFKTILLIGISYRLLLFLFLSFIPYSHEAFGPISPLSFHYFADYGFYKNFGEVADQVNNFSFIDEFYNTFISIFSGNFEEVKSRFPGSTGIPNLIILPLDNFMALGMISFLSTIADAPKISIKLHFFFKILLIFCEIS